MTKPSLDIVPDGEPLPPSLWAATAPAAPPTPALRESIATDVLVIGGGYTGYRPRYTWPNAARA